MGLRPGAAYFGYRYAYSTEYVQIMKDLWAKGVCDFKGKNFQMSDCHMKPVSEHKIEIVAAGQSPTGMAFAASYADYNFVLASGVNTPTAHGKLNEQLIDAVAKTGRDVGAYVLFMVIADETDEAAMAKWQKYKDGTDVDALAWMADQASKDQSAAASPAAKTINLPEQALNCNMGTIVASYATVANLLDEAATVPGTKGLMLTFDDFSQASEPFDRTINRLR